MADTSLPPRAGQTPLFAPKLITVLREGYHLPDLRADILAGLTVAIVALPLSMAIAIASGVSPDRGLITAIIGGFLVSSLGGSRFQIGGPAGAFIVLVSACTASIGLPGLILATFLSGFILAAAGLLRLGGYVRFIPYPVTLAFTAGIALIILASQIKDLFGLSLPHEPAPLLPKIQALWQARSTLSLPSTVLTALTIALILALRRLRPRWPGLLIAISLTALLAWLAALPVETIGSRFGQLPRSLPLPALPDLGLLPKALPWAASFALLAAIESLLSAVVADGMSGRLHRPDTELIAQGAANIGSALFGGFCVTGTIARTATNVRAGSQGPLSGILHALFLLLFLWIAAPLAAYIPLASLAGLLTVIAWSMAEKAEIWALIRTSRADATVILVTFLLVVFRDLTEGIIAGFALGGLVFIRRMAGTAQILAEHPDDAADDQTLVVRLQGPWFFGAAALTGAALDRIADHPRLIILDFAAVPMIDSSGARTVERLAHRIHRRGGALAITAASPDVRRNLTALGLTEPIAQFHPDIATARNR